MSVGFSKTLPLMIYISCSYLLLLDFTLTQLMQITLYIMLMEAIAFVPSNMSNMHAAALVQHFHHN